MNELFFDDFLKEEESLFESRINLINAEFIDEITLFTESIHEMHYITEKQKDSFGIKLKKFFANLIASVKSAINSLTIEFKNKLKSSAIQKNLRKLYKELEEKKQNGETKVEVIDIWSLSDVYFQYEDALSSYAKKFCKMNYKNTSQIDNDLKKFNDIVDNYEKQIDFYSNKKVTKNIDDLIKFIEYEISGRTNIMERFSKSTQALEQMKNEADVLLTKKNILGPDVIPHHVGCIRKMATRFTLFIRKVASRIISVFVFIVGRPLSNVPFVLL